jgi:hypothetical protein
MPYYPTDSRAGEADRAEAARAEAARAEAEEAARAEAARAEAAGAEVEEAASAEAAVESLIRGYHLVNTEPKGPVYICFDTDVQEGKLDKPFEMEDLIARVDTLLAKADL